MRKYVAKQDVEKGLVDLSKPLTEQKQYLERIQKNQKSKHYYQKKKDMYVSRQRWGRGDYGWRRQITEDTPIPQQPQQQIKYPDETKFHEQLNGYKREMAELYEIKNGINNEYKMAAKNKSENQKKSKMLKTKYAAILKQKYNVRKQMRDELKILNEKNDEIQKQYNIIKNKINSYKQPQSFQNCSIQQLQRKLQKTQQKLTAVDLQRKQQNRINMKILQIKRAKLRARSEVQINQQISKLQESGEVYSNQLSELKPKIQKKNDEVTQVSKEINKIKQEQSSVKIQIQDTRTIEQIKKDVDKKLQDISKQISTIKQKIQQLKQDYNKKIDQYKNYQDILSEIKFIKQQKQKIKKRKQQQEKRKKQQQEKQKNNNQQFQQKQKNKKLKQIKNQQRKKQISFKKQQLFKQKQIFINLNPHQQKIDISKVLIQYCEGLNSDNSPNKMEKRQQKIVHPMTELHPDDSQEWAKQLNKGAQVIVSKKQRQEQQMPKKSQKQKKKKEKQSNQAIKILTHSIQISKLFEKINLLPPLTITQLDSIIKALNQRIQLYSKPTQQQIAAYKIKASKQFDRLHGINSESRIKKKYKQKNEKQKIEYVEKEKKQ